MLYVWSLTYIITLPPTYPIGYIYLNCYLHYISYTTYKKRGELLTSTHKQSAVRGFLEDSYAKTHHNSPKLRFFDVEIREYAVTASDNPTVRSGTGLEVRFFGSFVYFVSV